MEEKSIQRVKELLIRFGDENVNKKMDAEFNRGLWEQCGEMGIFSILSPKNVGGIAESYSDILVVSKMLGYAFQDSGFVFAINNSMIVTSGVFPKFASKEMRQEYCNHLLSGKLIASFAITEQNSGTDAFDMKTTATFTEDKIILNGNKMYISNGPIADIFVVIAKNENIKKKAYTAFLVKRGDKGFKIGQKIPKMGLEQCPMSELIFDKCELPKSRIIGGVGFGMLIGNLVLDWERCISFSSHVGTMERIVEKCISYVNERKQFGKTIGQYQLVAEKIAKMQIAIEMSNLLMHKLGELKDDKKNTFLESSEFKYYVGENYAKVCMEAMQIFGASGYCTECGIEQEVRDALGSKIYSGTSEIQLVNIAKLIGIKV